MICSAARLAPHNLFCYRSVNDIEWKPARDHADDEFPPPGIVDEFALILRAYIELAVMTDNAFFTHVFVALSQILDTDFDLRDFHYDFIFSGCDA